MLTRLSGDNFRALRKFDVALSPLTVLIGSNDTGKSSFLRALRILNQGAEWNQKDFWRKDPKAVPSLVGWSDGKIVTESRPGTYSGRPVSVAYYELPAQGPSLVSQGYADAQGASPFQDLGHEVPALFDLLLRRERAKFFEAEKLLTKLIPGLESIDVATPTSETRRIDLVVDQGLRVDPDSVSTGVRLLLFFVALSYHPNAPDLVLIEEPENGIHPQRLKDVIDLLRKMTEGGFRDQKHQIVISTHSPYLVDHLDLSTDSLLVFRREADGTRTVTKAEPGRLKSFLSEFLLGEVWFNRGEEGLIGPPPASSSSRTDAD